MFAPGLISLAFYRRRPSGLQIAVGLVATIALSAVLGYFSPLSPLGTLGSILAAIAGGVVLYFGILALLVYWYQPRRARADTTAPSSTET